MIAPIQLVDFVVHETVYEQNPEWEPIANARTLPRVFVRGDLSVGPDADAPDPDQVWLDFDLSTSLFTLADGDAVGVPAEEVRPGSSYYAHLRIGVNDIGDTPTRSPFALSVACSAQIVVLSIPDERGAEREFVRVVRANAAGMLYSMARHLVLSLTQTTSRVLLPSLTFARVVEHELEVEAREE